MHVGILSDTHNNRENTSTALAAFRQRGVSRLFHCGDLTSPGMVPLFAGFQATFVRGNIDQDPEAIQRAVQAIPGLTWAGREATAEIDGRRLAMCHGDDERQLTGLIRLGVYAYVLHGHTHRQRDERIGPTRVLNPGALGGLRAGPRTIYVLDPQTDSLEVIRIAP